ncbi:MAG: nitrogen fixation protein NifX [Gorillibacterium sp.]|nr:nitrogen fixation protein NifX [Gorillibacterium sp.]
MKVAFASINGKHLDCHFGQCPSFSIFDFSEQGYKWLESRSVFGLPVDAEEQERIGQRIQIIWDCKLLFANNIGNYATEKVMRAGIMLLKPESGAEVIPQLEKMQQMMKERPPLWLAKALRRSEEEANIANTRRGKGVQFGKS